MVRKLFSGVVILALAIIVAHGSGAAALPAPDPTAVAEVMAGLRTEANAAWWGFDPEDSTEYLQAAIDSGVPRLIVPNMGADWVVRPIFLRSDLEIIFEEGVVVTAKKGEFLARSDCLFTATGVENLIIRGYGATFRMHKEDYMAPPYRAGEWRMGLRITGSKNVQVLGLTIRDTGGDGIYIGRGELGYSENIVIRDVVADNNHRQGMSVISVKNLLVENSVFKNTQGTPPMAGIDFEPNQGDEFLENIVVRNTVLEGNESSGVVMNLKPLGNDKKVSFLMENILIRGNGGGINIKGLPHNHPGGEIVIRNCIMEDVRKNAIRIEHINQDTLSIVFDGCILHNVTTEPNLHTGNPHTSVPIFLEGPTRIGDIRFHDFLVQDSYNRPTVYVGVANPSTRESFVGVTGRIDVINPYGAQVRWGINTPNQAALDGIQLDVVDQQSAVVDYSRVLSLPGYEPEPVELVMPPTIHFYGLDALPPYSTVQGVYSPDIRLLYFDEGDVRHVEVLLNGEQVHSGKAPTKGDITIDTVALPDERHELTIIVQSASMGRLESTTYFHTHNFDYLVDQFEGPRQVAWFGTVYNPRSIDQSDGWQYVSDEQEHFFGDGTRKTRINPTDEFIVWHTPGLREIHLSVYATDPSFEEFFILEGSADQEVWETIPYTATIVDTSAAGWHQFDVGGDVTPEEDRSYVRLVLKEASVTDDIQLGHARFKLLRQ